jgi:hypothetical protein
MYAGAPVRLMTFLNASAVAACAENSAQRAGQRRQTGDIFMAAVPFLPVEILHQEDPVARVAGGIFHIEAAVGSGGEASAAVFVPDTKLHKRGGFVGGVVRAMFA